MRWVVRLGGDDRIRVGQRERIFAAPGAQPRPGGERLEIVGAVRDDRPEVRQRVVRLAHLGEGRGALEQGEFIAGLELERPRIFDDRLDRPVPRRLDQAAALVEDEIVGIELRRPRQ